MTEQEIKSFIAEKVPEGNSLSKIQDMLKSQGVNITFMELRLIASELESGLWKKEDAEKEAERSKADQAAVMAASRNANAGADYPAPGAENGAMAPGMGRGMGRPSDMPAEPYEDGAEEEYASNASAAAQDAEEVPAPAPAGEENTPSSGTTVELSPIARPGAVASGTVKFGSGVTADWVLDRTGRIGLDSPTGSPTQQDIQDFQMELQKLFAR